MRPYVNGYTAPAPGFVYTPIDWRNRKLDGYGNVTETGTVPGVDNDYTVELDERIVKNGALTVTSGGDVLSIVPYGVAPGLGQAAVSYDLPLVKINSAREAEVLEVFYTPGGGVISAGRFNELQRAFIAAASSTEIHNATFFGVAQGTEVLAYIVIPARGKTSRTIKRVTITAGDVSNLSGESEFYWESLDLLQSGSLGTLTKAGALTDGFVTSTPLGTFDTSSGDLSIKITGGGGGHGNLNFQIEVE